MLTLNIAIEQDQKGNHTVVYPVDDSEWHVPGSYDERLEWIRQSCARFLENVLKRDEMRDQFEIN